MKKYLILFMLMTVALFPYSFAAGKAFSLMGKFTESGSTTNTVDNTGFYFEFYPKSDDGLEAGIGIKYNSYKEKETKTSYANVTTLYGVARFKTEFAGMNPFIQVKGGYPYSWDGDLIPDGENLKGQAFGSLGAGVQIAYLDFSVNYELNVYNHQRPSGSDKTVLHNGLNVTLGFKY